MQLEICMNVSFNGIYCERKKAIKVAHLNYLADFIYLFIYKHSKTDRITISDIFLPSCVNPIIISATQRLIIKYTHEHKTI